MRIPAALIVAASLFGAANLRAEQPTVFGGLRLAPRAPQGSPQAEGRRNPYGRLFGDRARPVLPDARQASSPARHAPEVKCGMTLIPGAPRIDPGIVAPTSTGVERFHLRSVEPKICW